VHALSPAISHFLFNRATGKLKPRPVEEISQSVYT
jgi:hypothetical protein